MAEFEFTQLFVLPILFGLVGFVEPCTVGSSLIVIKHLEGRSESQKMTQMLIFAVTRALFIGLLGIIAVWIGSLFLALQKAAWLVLGLIYLVLGVLYLTKRTGPLFRSIGPSVTRLGATRGSVGLGLLFGLNIPACAAPLLLLLLSSAATGGAAGATAVAGFTSLSLFGLALSLPLVVVVFFDRARILLDRLATLSERMPIATGLLLIALGLWSAWFGLFVNLDQ